MDDFRVVEVSCAVLDSEVAAALATPSWAGRVLREVGAAVGARALREVVGRVEAKAVRQEAAMVVSYQMALEEVVVCAAIEVQPLLRRHRLPVNESSGPKFLYLATWSVVYCELSDFSPLDLESQCHSCLRHKRPSWRPQCNSSLQEEKKRKFTVIFQTVKTDISLSTLHEASLTS